MCGCTDSGACNYNADATEDGSVSTKRALDAATAQLATTSLVRPSTMALAASKTADVNLFDSFGDGWNGAEYILSSVDGTVIGSGTIEAGNTSDTYCLADGCYTIEVSRKLPRRGFLGD